MIRLRYYLLTTKYDLSCEKSNVLKVLKFVTIDVHTIIINS